MDLLPKRFLVSDHKLNRLLIANAQGEIEWEYLCEHPQDSHYLADGTILAAVGHEAQIIRPDLTNGKGCEVLWRFRPGGEVPVVQPLADGGIMVAYSPGDGEPGVIVEFDKGHKEIRRVEVETKTTGHSQFRFCRKTLQDTYLIPAIGDGVLYEINADGNVLWELPLELVCSAVRLADETTIVAGAKTVRAYDKQKKEIWVLTERELGFQPNVLAGMHIGPDETITVANWGTDCQDEISTAAFSVSTKQCCVTWRMASDPLIGSVAHLQII